MTVNIDIESCKDCPRYEYTYRDALPYPYIFHTCRETHMSLPGAYGVPDWCPLRAKKKAKRKKK